jgi:hypothetical protein
MKAIYDIHYHAFDLSHANIISFIDRWLDSGSIANTGVLKQKSFISESIIPTFINLFANKKQAGIRNTLGVMEMDFKLHFLMIEHFLRNKDEVIKNNRFCIGKFNFEKLIICPLMMDFGYKNMVNQGAFYNLPPEKPILQQTDDLFNAIKTYYSNELVIEEKSVYLKICQDKPKLFHLLPFIGINPVNFKSVEKLEKLLIKFFNFPSDESLVERKKKLLNNQMFFKEFTGSTDNYQDFTYSVAGIKLYPPLGFNPGRIDNKSKYLYKFCEDRNIPITTHCSDGGFNAVGENAQFFSNPANGWLRVLEKYPKLKLNFAHFGSEKKGYEWRKTILKLMLKYSNVYSDISYSAYESKYYQKLEKWLKRNSTSLKESKILFGSDFFINLLDSNSYNAYWKELEKANLDENSFNKITIENPEKFLFE